MSTRLPMWPQVQYRQSKASSLDARWTAIANAGDMAEGTRMLEYARALTPEILLRALAWNNQEAVWRFLGGIQRSPLFRSRSSLVTDAHREALLRGALWAYGVYPSLDQGVERLDWVVRQGLSLPPESPAMVHLLESSLEWAESGTHRSALRLVMTGLPWLPGEYLERLLVAGAGRGTPSDFLAPLLAHPNTTRAMMETSIARAEREPRGQLHTFVGVAPALLRDPEHWERLMAIRAEDPVLTMALATHAPDVRSLASLERSCRSVPREYGDFIRGALTNPHFRDLSPETQATMLLNADGADRLRLIAAQAPKAARRARAR